MGERGVAFSTRAGEYTLKTDKDLSNKINNDILIVLKLGSNNSLDNVADMVEVDGVDIMCIGLYDLSQAIGIPSEVEHPDVLTKSNIFFSFVNNPAEIKGSFANTQKEQKD